VVPPTIQYKRDGRIVQITMSGFNRRTGISLVESLERAQEELGSDLAGVILDLRGNPGGLLDQGVAVADAFMPEGPISTTEGRHPDALHTFVAGGKDSLGGKPLVVLINGRTASSSEMVAAALQDRGRAIVLGSASYGKGSVQSVNDLPDDSELIITWSLIHAPSGYAFHRLGVLPTVCTAHEDTMSQLVTNMRAGALAIRPALKQWRAAVWPRQKDELAALKALCPASSDSPEIDVDLAREILLDRSLYDRLLVQSRAVLTASTE
jgi:carboxyl-terminal processing protease